MSAAARDAAGATPMVRFDKVTKRYGALTVLDSLDLEVAAGEKVAIIGPSGSGKTTVLRMLMTLETINDGVIWVDGEPLTHMQRERRAWCPPISGTSAASAARSAWCSSTSICSRT